MTGVTDNYQVCTAVDISIEKAFTKKVQDPLGQQVYAEYHAFLEVAKTEVSRGLLLDLHGQNHQQNSIGDIG